MKERILEHMNGEHKELLPIYIKHFNGRDVKEAKLVDINEEEMILLTDENKKIIVKLTEKTELKDMHLELVKMANIAREALGLNSDSDKKQTERDPKEEKLKEEISDFISSFKSVILGTLTKDNFPTVSYAPILKEKEKFYIFISESGEHFENLKNNGKLEVMFIEDESKSKVISLRKRVRYQAKATFLERNAEIEVILDKFETVEPMIKMTRTMQDFHLVELEFSKGRYVKGAGQAFYIMQDGSIVAITGAGHGHREMRS